MSRFDQDKLANEKQEPSESSSLTFINVPLVLLSLLVGFGATYLALRTPDMRMEPGDSRTAAPAVTASGEAPSADGEVDLEKTLERGKAVYAAVCQACHQENGQGMAGVFPPLANSPWVLGSALRMTSIILHGVQGPITVNGEKFSNVMPGLREAMSPEDVAAVATYVRGSFGNKASPVTLETVRRALARPKADPNPWNGEDELNAQKWEDEP